MKNQNKPLLTFKAISFLLSYPEESWIVDIQDLLTCIENESKISTKALAELAGFVSFCKTTDLLQLQTEYVATFDQQRALSLHLFEHIHGDSRDRGQAMVDLSEVYNEQGFLIDAKELPDYLPLFLEYLSQISADSALELLQECIHIIERIASSLAERGNRYTAVFNAMLSLGAKPLQKWTVNLDAPLYDPSAADRLDKEWAEEEVKFLGNNTCTQSSACGKA